MIRFATLLSLALLLGSVQMASADFFDDCRQECQNTQAQCVAAITLYDEAGIQEAKNACADAQPACMQKCHDMDAVGKEQYQKNEEEQKARQEQESGSNDGIKTLKLGD